MLSITVLTCELNVSCNTRNQSVTAIYSIEDHLISVKIVSHDIFIMTVIKLWCILKCVQCKTFIIAPSVILTQPFNACKKRSVSFDYITQCRFDSLLELKQCLLVLNVKIIGIWRQVNEVSVFVMYWAGRKRQRGVTQFLHGQCHFTHAWLLISEECCNEILCTRDLVINSKWWIKR